jgi:hypothetical protein
MAPDGSSMVEDAGVSLAFGWPQDAAHHLAVEAKLLRRSRQDGATHRRTIPAFGEHHAVRHHLGLARGQSGQDGFALRDWRLAADVLGAHAGADKFIPDADGVRHVHGEGNGARLRSPCWSQSLTTSPTSSAVFMRFDSALMM